MTANNRSSYIKITDSQREILSRYYDNGMTSKAAARVEQIQAASNETDLSLDRVKYVM
jgi:hypothetical protein